MQSWLGNKLSLVVACARNRPQASVGLWAVALLALSACAPPPQIDTLAGPRVQPAQNAFAVPGPGGPAVLSVIEQRYANAVEQRILLATSSHVSGQNMLRVQLFGPVDPAASGQTRLREGFLAPSNVETEMRQLIPGVRMTRSPYYAQNRYGPFGYAVGRAASGDICLYGWQRMTSTGSTQTLIGNRGSIQLRLRYCDKTLPEKALLQAMYDFTITAFFRTGGWNPFGEPNAPPETLGRSGAPQVPTGYSGVADVAPPRPSQASTRTGSPSRTTTVAASPQQVAPIGPKVPPPPGFAEPDAASRQGAAPEAGAKHITNAQPTVVVPPPPCDAATTACE